MSSLAGQYRLYGCSIYPPMRALRAAAVPNPADSTPHKHGTVPARRSGKLNRISDILLQQNTKPQNLPPGGVQTFVDAAAVERNFILARARKGAIGV